MTLRYDQSVDALDIRLRGGADFARTVEVEEGTLVDLDSEGCVIAIEVIAPARPWPVAEIIERFRVEDADAAMLRELFREHARYPFAEEGAIASAAADLVIA